MAKTESITKIASLALIKFISFYEALKTDNYESLNLDEESYHNLKDEFDELIKIKKGNLDKQISKINREISILKSSLIVYITNQEDEKIIEVLNSLNIEINKDLKITVKNIKVYIKALNEKIDFLNSTKPLEDKSDKKPVTAYSLLGSLSVSLEMSLGKFSEITVIEYISYRNALIDKNNYIKSNLNNGKSRSNNIRGITSK